MTPWRDSFGKPSDDLGALMWLAASADENGETRTSYRTLATAWGWSLAKVQRFIARGQKHGALIAKSIRDETRITVVLQRGSERPRAKDDTPTDTPQTDLLGEPVKRSRRKPRTALTEAWKFPAEWGEWAITEGMSREEARVAAREFRLFWISNGDLKADWKATWQKRVYALLDKKSVAPAGGEGSMIAAMAEKYR